MMLRYWIKKIESPDQDNPGIRSIINTSTSANEVWTVVGNKKKTYVTSQPKVTQMSSSPMGLFRCNVSLFLSSKSFSQCI
jgi:hypothetical protein